MIHNVLLRKKDGEQGMDSQDSLSFLRYDP